VLRLRRYDTIIFQKKSIDWELLTLQINNYRILSPDRQTYGQTDRCDYTTPLRGWSTFNKLRVSRS